MLPFSLLHAIVWCPVIDKMLHGHSFRLCPKIHRGSLLSVKIIDEQRHGWAMDDHNNTVCQDTDPIQSQFSLSIAAVPNSSLFLLVVSYIVSLIADGISVFA